MIPQDIARAINVTAELMGGKKPTEDALAVMISRLKEHPESVIKSVLRWLSEHDNGTLTLKKLVEAIASIASSSGAAKTSTGCSANGCPMRGSIFADGNWRCRFHMREIIGPKADAITTALRKNTEMLDAISDLSNTTSQGAWVAGNKLEALLGKEISEEIAANRKRIDEYVANDVSQSDVMSKLSPMLRKWGVA